MTCLFPIWITVQSSGIEIMKLLLTRHRLGCFCTHHSLGGDRIRPPVLSRKRIDVERRTRRHSKDLDEALPNHFQKFKIEVTCQVNFRSNVKIGCFQVADCSDLKRSIFRPKVSICTPKDQTKVLTGEIINYFISSPGQGQGQDRKGHQTQNFQMSRLTHVLWSILDEELNGHGYFTIWLNLNEKNEKIESRSGQKGKKGQIFIF